MEAPDPIAEVRGAMSRRDDFDPIPERYAGELNISAFEAEAAMEALRVEGEVLA